MGNHFVTTFYSIDEEILILTARSILERFSLEIPEIYGMTISRYGILPSILVMPLYLLGKTIGRLFFPDSRNYCIVFFCYSMNAFITALVMVYFYGFSRLLKYPRKTALYSTLVLGLCAIVFPFAKYFFSAPLVSLALLASFYHFVKYDRGKELREIFLSSIWFALLLLTRIDGISLIPVYAFGLIFVHIRRNRRQAPGGSDSLVLKHAVCFMIPVFLAIAAHSFINYLKYGSFLKSGYGNEAFSTSLIYGFYGLLFSSGRGFFIYSPPMILAFFCIARFWKKHPLAAALIVFAALIRLYLFAKWWGWHGGLSWGPRYIIPLVPLLGLMINETLLRFKKFPPGLRILILTLILSGFLVQIIAALVSPTKTNTNIYTLVNGDENQALFIPQVSAIAGNMNMIRKGVIDSFIMNFTDKFSPVFLVFILIFLTGTMLFSLLGLIKNSGCRSDDIIVLKPPKTLNASERIAVILIVLNVILFSICHIGISSNKIPRYTVATYEDGAENYLLNFDTLLCLEEKGFPDAGANGARVKEAKMKWTGYILLPLKGEYQFHVKTRGKYVLMIDDRVISVHAEDVAQVTIPSIAEFERGYYKFYVEYFPADLENQVFHIYATFPGFGFYKTLLSNRNVFADMPTIPQKMILSLDNFKIFFTLLSIMAWYLARSLCRKNPD
jgi:hypothetical protein